jgi:hypothetical protein
MIGFKLSIKKTITIETAIAEFIVVVRGLKGILQKKLTINQLFQNKIDTLYLKKAVFFCLLWNSSL